MKTVILIALIALISPSEWLTDFQQAQRQAKAEHKLILISFSGSDWCGPCIKMKQEVYTSAAFDTVAVKKLVLVHADFPRAKKNQLPAEQVKRNEGLAEQYNPQGRFPYTVLTDESGTVIKTWDGYAFGSQDKFILELTVAIN